MGMKSLRSVFNVSGCLMLIIGVALLAIPAVYGYLSNRADGNSVEVTGTVIAMYTTTSWSSDQNRNVTYYCPLLSIRQPKDRPTSSIRSTAQRQPPIRSVTR